jgi:hypothetical protein
MTSQTGFKMPSGQLLDMQIQELGISQISYELAEILDALGLKPTMKAFDILAHDLSRVARKMPPWSKKYIHSAYHGKIEVSPVLRDAINSLAQMIDGTPAGVAGSVWVRVLASPDIPEGALIPASAKVIKCAKPGCPVRFVRIHPRQIYHDPECSKWRGKR